MRRAFVIYEEPDKIPQKKGPFVRDSEVEKMLREMKPHHHADTKYTVAEITFDFDLWLTTASEFLWKQEVARVPDDEPNTNALPRPAKQDVGSGAWLGSEITNRIHMKRYLSFQGSVYYPSGGMGDFFADFDTQEEAVAAVIAHAKKENSHDAADLWRFSWANVWDSQERREVWQNP